MLGAKNIIQAPPTPAQINDATLRRCLEVNQRARAPGAELRPRSHSSSGGTPRPDGSRGGAIKIVNNGGLASCVPPQSQKANRLILIAGHCGFYPGRPRIPSAAEGRTPKPRAPGARPVGVCAWGALIALPQTTGPTETPDRELTQLAREKTPSTAPMVMRLMEVAQAEAPSAVVTAG